MNSDFALLFMLAGNNLLNIFFKGKEGYGPSISTHWFT